MNFDKQFWIRTIEDGFRSNGIQNIGFVSQVEKSEAWKKHAQNCDRAQIVTVEIGNTRLIVNKMENRNDLLDESKWRKSLEARANFMLQGNSTKIQEDGIKSDNFSSRNEDAVKIYEKQLSCNVGCMCGVAVGVDSEVHKSNNYGVTVDSGIKSGIYTVGTASGNSGKTYKS